MFHQLLAEILPSLTKGRPNNNTNNNNNNNKAKCIPGGTLRVLAGKKECFCHQYVRKHMIASSKIFSNQIAPMQCTYF
jgi:hypothetical protein